MSKSAPNPEAPVDLEAKIRAATPKPAALLAAEAEYRTAALAHAAAVDTRREVHAMIRAGTEGVSPAQGKRADDLVAKTEEPMRSARAALERARDNYRATFLKQVAPFRAEYEATIRTAMEQAAAAVRLHHAIATQASRAGFADLASPDEVVVLNRLLVQMVARMPPAEGRDA